MIKSDSPAISDGTSTLNGTSSLMSGELKDTHKGKFRETDGEGGATGPGSKSLQNAKFNPFSCDNDVTGNSSLNNTNHNSTYTSYNNSCSNSAQNPKRIVHGNVLGQVEGHGQGQRLGQVYEQGLGKNQGHLDKYPPLITKPGVGPQSLPLIPKQGQGQGQGQGQTQGQYLRRSAKRQSGGYLSHAQAQVRYFALYDSPPQDSTLFHFD